MNTNISKLQAQLQGLSPQQLQMAVQGGAAPPWLVAIEQQRRADMAKRMQAPTPPQSTVMQDLEGAQGLQGIQAFAGGGETTNQRRRRSHGIMPVDYAAEQNLRLPKYDVSPADRGRTEAENNAAFEAMRQLSTKQLMELGGSYDNGKPTDRESRGIFREAAYDRIGDIEKGLPAVPDLALAPEEESPLEAVELNVPPLPGELAPAPDPYIEKINAMRQQVQVPSRGIETIPDESGVSEDAQIMEALKNLPPEQFKEIVARANAKEMSPQDTFRVLQELNRRGTEQSKAWTIQTQPSPIPQAAPVTPQPVESPASPQVSQGIANLSPQEYAQLPPDILAEEERLKRVEDEIAAQKAAKAAEQLGGHYANLDIPGLPEFMQQKTKEDQEQQVLAEEKPMLDKKIKDAQEWEEYLESRRQAHAGIAQLVPKEAPPVSTEVAPLPQVPQAVQQAPVNQAVSQGIAQVAAEPSPPVDSLPPEPVPKPFVYADQPAEFTKGIRRMRESLNADDAGPKLRTVKSEKNIAERESRLKDFEDNNLGWSVMQAAAAMMAGDSPYASVNIGKGAMAGLQKYADGKKNINDLGREINELRAGQETAYNERDFKTYIQKQNQLAMMTELAERANQSSQNRVSQEEMNAANLASHERMARGHDAAMLESAGIRATSAGGAGDPNKHLRDAVALSKQIQDTKAKFEKLKSALNADLTMDKDDKAQALIKLEEDEQADLLPLLTLYSSVLPVAGLPGVQVPTVEGGAGSNALVKKLNKVVPAPTAKTAPTAPKKHQTPADTKIRELYKAEQDLEQHLEEERSKWIKDDLYIERLEENLRKAGAEREKLIQQGNQQDKK